MENLIIASVLKPVNDTRMYEKFGRSILKPGKYKVNIAGSHAPAAHDDQIRFHPVFRYQRSGPGRVFAFLKLARLIRRLNATIVILTTWELLPVVWLIKPFREVKFIYDIRENYARNVRYSSHSGSMISRILKVFLIRVVERTMLPLTDQVIIAEESYRQELKLPEKKTTLIRNLFQPDIMASSVEDQYHNTIRLLFSGTLSRDFGVFRAIRLAELLHELEPRIELTIIGYCALAKEREELLSLTSKHSWIKTMGISYLVPHSEILAEISKADFGIISYRHLPHIAGCMPTRMYEYIGSQLPILLTDHPMWVDFCRTFNAAVPVNFNQLNQSEIQKILQLMSQKEFYQKDVSPVYWKREEAKLLQLIKNI